MDPTLQRLYAGFERELSGVGPQRMQLRPAGHPERWSVQQIVQHLLMTYSATSGNFEQRIAKGTPTAATVSLGQRVGQFAVCTLGLFPKGREAPAIVVPADGEPPLSGESMLESAGGELRRLDEVARQAAVNFGNVRAIQHPVLGPMGVHNWLRFHLVHGEHHLRQVAGILGGAAQPADGSSTSIPSATGK